MPNDKPDNPIWLLTCRYVSKFLAKSWWYVLMLFVSCLNAEDEFFCHHSHPLLLVACGCVIYSFEKVCNHEDKVEIIQTLSAVLSCDFEFRSPQQSIYTFLFVTLISSPISLSGHTSIGGKMVFQLDFKATISYRCWMNPTKLKVSGLSL